MEVYMPSKEEWQQMQNDLTAMVKQVAEVAGLLSKGQAADEHFPEFMDIPVAAKYLKCPVSRIKNMIYKQKLLLVHHIDLTTTVYVAKKDIDELKYRVLAIRGMEKKLLKNKE
jgi:hypothetical protein